MDSDAGHQYKDIVALLTMVRKRPTVTSNVHCLSCSMLISCTVSTFGDQSRIFSYVVIMKAALFRSLQFLSCDAGMEPTIDKSCTLL